jgi:hypothetical protein
MFQPNNTTSKNNLYKILNEIYQGTTTESIVIDDNLKEYLKNNRKTIYLSVHPDQCTKIFCEQDCKNLFVGLKAIIDKLLQDTRIKYLKYLKYKIKYLQSTNSKHIIDDRIKI